MNLNEVTKIELKLIGVNLNYFCFLNCYNILFFIICSFNSEELKIYLCSRRIFVFILIKIFQLMWRLCISTSLLYLDKEITRTECRWEVTNYDNDQNYASFSSSVKFVITWKKRRLIERKKCELECEKFCKLIMYE